MDIGEPERSGRHRLEDGAAPWLPLGGELDHAPTPPAPRAAPPGGTPPPGTPAGHDRPPDDPHDRAPRAAAPHARLMDQPPAIPAQRDRFADPADREVLGLGTFNIGLVPASVTPPRTWKRAAWFAVLSSAGVLVGLVVAAIKLVGAGSPTDRLGMPGYPTSAPIVTGFGTSTPSSAPPVPGKRGERPEALVAPEHTAEASRTAVSGTSVVPTSSAPSTSPTVTTVPGDGKPVVDSVAVAARTERFYEQAVANAATALEMVTDTFEADAKALLEGHFGQVSAIEVTEISVDPARGVTISTLHVKNKDGSTTTEKRQLVFTTNGDPLIDAERLFGGV
ncbi:hypothetical protein [Saccharothrix variisporea]|uniref:Uncharacterized protein n=1 Tax=Saccharothrix variisporea TaxID=543527 RepID=A0A495XG79_9PSEU|nr:hypothetical protein [Saccharothrix variisporea]RKT72216.1 hypothetical protein DFJ66_5524 [Saccharothrix variisporea]